MEEIITNATITATASGSQTPATATRPETVINGDFEISGNNELAPIVGDGLDEFTSWTFDFTQDSKVLAFQGAESITGAKLTLELKATGGVNTDVTGIEGLPKYVDSPVIKNLPLNEISTIEIDLLDTYTSEEILGALQGGDFGKFGMYYDDDAIVSQASLELSGEIGANTIVGTPEDDFLFGLSGDTTILGLEGDDRIISHGGNDTIDGGDGQDVVDAGVGDDNLSGENGNDVLLGGEGNDSLLGGAGNDWLSGDIGNDILLGGSGEDYLFAGDGDDLIQGDAGDDVLYGGLGADGFNFQSPNFGVDVIEDFNIAEGDFIQIGLNFGASSTESV